MIKVRIPATTANIGSGFDVFGMAFQFYNYVSIEKGTGLDICPRCNGNKKFNGETCPECNGRGIVKCYACGGRGIID